MVKAYPLCGVTPFGAAKQLKFIGIDFGWTSQPSGLCGLEWRDRQLHLVELTRLGAIADILAWVDQFLPANCPGGIAVDAPTLIPNETGMRLPDRLAHKHFGKYHAGCYPANRSLPFAERVLQLGSNLEARGFHHAPDIHPQQTQRFQIEVFPHPAMIHLFGLSRILKYKKGRVAERRSELIRLRDYLLTVLPSLEPALHLSSLPAIPTKGTALKVVEDQLDSIICAYVAAHWWYWGIEKNWVLGDRTSGYIIVPAP